ncbi:hypothetical protein [Paracoccus aestuariivivens]|uniref:Transmembrane protein n=1 Tax=Paracoccus aestuariivivens TaxID=1820333 RepID=A0A6L6JFA0_9RHOB|nr:hypothetical protein [Paracoccus aestuariivivens]MTH79925.1 hypothetical protein [Paracoccus aestuariivivens]
MAQRHRSLWHMIIAPVIWALHFLAVYCFSAIVCAKAAPFGWAQGGVLAMTAVALALIFWQAVLAWRQWDFLDDGDHVHERPTATSRREFLGHAGLLLAIVSFIAVTFVTLPVLFVGDCR